MNDSKPTIATEYSRRLRETMPQPRRRMAPFWWFGGKGMLVRWVLQYIPETQRYVEPFAGAAWVFWHLPEGRRIEVLNDIDGEIVNVYRCLQDPQLFEELAHRLTWTPYARAELQRALETPPTSPVERAWSFLVKLNFGFGGRVARSAGDWGRQKTVTGKLSSRSWAGRVALLDWFHERLRHVQIDNRDAIEVIRYWDGNDCVFYIDPPYVLDTRNSQKTYSHEMSNDQHELLVQTLLNVKGCVVLSGYEHPIYEPLVEAGWRMFQRETVSHAAGRVRGSELQGVGAARRKVKRVECLWINPACVEWLKQQNRWRAADE